MKSLNALSSKCMKELFNFHFQRGFRLKYILDNHFWTNFSSRSRPSCLNISIGDIQDIQLTIYFVLQFISLSFFNSSKCELCRKLSREEFNWWKNWAIQPVLWSPWFLANLWVSCTLYPTKSVPNELLSVENIKQLCCQTKIKIKHKKADNLVWRRWKAECSLLATYHYLIFSASLV